MVLSLYKHKIISVQGGQQWRPILHVTDAANAFIKIANLESENDIKMINGELFNVGSNEQNYQMQTLAMLIAKAINPQTKIIVQDVQTDFRSYKVSFDKIKDRLDYVTSYTPQLAAQEIFNGLQDHLFTDSIQTKTLDWYKHLLSKNPLILDDMEYQELKVT